MPKIGFSGIFSKFLAGKHFFENRVRHTKALPFCIFVQKIRKKTNEQIPRKAGKRTNISQIVGIQGRSKNDFLRVDI